MTYLEALAHMRSRRRVGNNTWLIDCTADDKIKLRLHNTDIVVFTPHGMTLNSGGWRTITTLHRMNQWIAPWHITQRDYEWYLSRNDATECVVIDYADGILLRADGGVQYPRPAGGTD